MPITPTNIAFDFKALWLYFQEIQYQGHLLELPQFDEFRNTGSVSVAAEAKSYVVHEEEDVLGGVHVTSDEAAVYGEQELESVVVVGAGVGSVEVNGLLSDLMDDAVAALSGM